MSGFDLAALRGKIKEGQGGGSKDRFVPYKQMDDDSEAAIRFLPLKDGSHWRVDHVHHIIPGDNSYKKYTCPESIGEKCPLCEKARELFDQKKDDLAIQYWKKHQYLSQVVIRNFEEIDDLKDAEMPIIYGYGKKIEAKLVAGVMDDEIGVFFDPKEGFDFKLRKTIVKGFANYDNSEFARKQTSLGSASDIEQWMDARIDLNEKIAPPLEYDELVELLGGSAPSTSSSSKNESYDDKPASLDDVPQESKKTETESQNDPAPQNDTDAEDDEEFKALLASLQKD